MADLNFVPLSSVFYTEPYNNIRRNKIICFDRILYKNTKFTSMTYDKKTEILLKLEKGCWSSCDNDYDKYHDICFNVAMNLDPESLVHSEFLIDKVLGGDIQLDMVGGLSSRDLCPEKYLKYQENFDKRSSVKESQKTSKLYRCFKCKKNQCSIERNYCRSGDESIPLTITCQFCNNSWNG